MNRKILFCLLFAVCALVYVLLFSRSTSPLFWISELRFDQTTYQVMGFNWLEGRIPYRDLFDLKGPMIFATNAAGYWLTGNRYGITVIQVILIFFSFVYCYKLLHIEFNWQLSLAGTIATFMCLNTAYDEGDNVEELVLPFLFAAYYYGYSWLKEYEKNGKTRFNWAGPVSFGLVLGVSAMSRLTNAIGVCTLAAITGLLMANKKQYKDIGKCAVIFFVTAIVVCLPFITYYLLKGALSDFIYCTWTVASRYASFFHVRQHIDMYHIAAFSPTILLTIVAALSAMQKNNKKRVVSIAFLLVGLVSLIWFAYGIRSVKYAAIGLPFTAVALNLCSCMIKSGKKKTIIASAVTAITIAIGTWYTALDAYSALLANKLVTPKHKLLCQNKKTNEILQIADVIPQDKRKGIICLDMGDETYLYVLLKARPPYKYFSVVSGISSFDNTFLTEELEEYRSGNAEYIVTKNNNSEFEKILKERYTAAYTTTHYILYRLKTKTRQ